MKTVGFVLKVKCRKLHLTETHQTGSLAPHSLSSKLYKEEPHSLFSFENFSLVSYNFTAVQYSLFASPLQDSKVSKLFRAQYKLP